MIRKLVTACCLGLFLSLAPAWALAAEPPAPELSPALTPGTFSIGASYKFWRLTGDKNFYGSITSSTVEETWTYYPNNLNLQYVISPYLSLLGEFDMFSANMENDGKLDWQVFTVGVNLRYPLWDRFIPRVTAGITYSNVRFKENNWWAYGFPNQSAYDQWISQMPQGKDPEEWMRSYSDKERVMHTDNAFGFTYGVGMDVLITQNLALNFDLRWHQSKSDVTYTISYNNGRDEVNHNEFTYNLDTLSYEVGLRWYF